MSLALITPSACTECGRPVHAAVLAGYPATVRVLLDAKTPVYALSVARTGEDGDLLIKATLSGAPAFVIHGCPRDKAEKPPQEGQR